MIEPRKRLFEDRRFMLSVYGLCLMITPLVLVTIIENLLLLIQPGGSSVLVDDAAWGLRKVCRAFFENQPVTVGIGIVLPTIGLGMVAVAWFSMIRRRYRKWFPIKTPMSD
ncbi:MAG: hypothetical protein JWP89_1678 [Schlesneria sp.]|nr:hypothetical protein [Schlesneria sp.]